MKFEVIYKEKSYWVAVYPKRNLSVIFPEKDNCGSIGGIEGVQLTPETAIVWLTGHSNGYEDGYRDAKWKAKAAMEEAFPEDERESFDDEEDN